MSDHDTKRAVLHIPSSQMLVDHTAQDWIESFQNMSGRIPSEVVLPGIDFSGPCFESRISTKAVGLSAGNLLENWVKDVRDAIGNEKPVWMSIIPSMAFLEVATVMVKDQFGHAFDGNACIANLKVQRLISDLISEAMQFGISGVVVDATDAYPNSSSNILPGKLQNTCFCNSCIDQLRLSGWQKGAKPFLSVHQNITRFGLQVTDTGTDHLDPRNEWVRDTDAQAMLNVSIARGFVNDDNSDVSEVEQLLRYCSARSRVTAKSLRAILKVATDANLKTAVILGSEHFDFTQCTTLDTLCKEETASEYWLPSIDEGYAASSGVSALQYLAGRATYTINAFFEIVQGLKSDSNPQVQDLRAPQLLRRSYIASSANQLCVGATCAVEYSPEYSGFIGIPLQPFHFDSYTSGRRATVEGEEEASIRDLVRHLVEAKQRFGARQLLDE